MNWRLWAAFALTLTSKAAGLSDRHWAAMWLQALSMLGSTKSSCRPYTTVLMFSTGRQSPRTIGSSTVPVFGSMFGCHVRVKHRMFGAWNGYVCGTSRMKVKLPPQ